MDGLGERTAQADGYGIADLARDLNLAAEPLEVGREALNQSRFKVCDGPVLNGMEVAALLRLVELRTDGDGRPVLTHTAHHIAGTAVVPVPALRGQVCLLAANRGPLASEIVTIAPATDCPVPRNGELGRGAADVKLGRPIRAREGDAQWLALTIRKVDLRRSLGSVREDGASDGNPGREPGGSSS